MIVAFSTSSPQASVALFEPDSTLIGAAHEHAPMAASGACIRVLERLLQDAGRELSIATMFAADLGPGSFTGVKVGVTLAKTFAFAFGTPAAGAASFDLIAPDLTVVLPSKRGEWYVRPVGGPPFRAGELPQSPFMGYGAGIEPSMFPTAAAFGALLTKLEAVQPEFLLPVYLAEPAISIPKHPYARKSGSMAPQENQ